MQFVLIHGAGHGAWCWRRVAGPLRAAGHEVHTPTLTGVGERLHLYTPAVGLATMIQDVVAVIEAEELTDAVLVGHSFGAMIALGVADRLPERLARLVLLDGVVVEAGRCAMDCLPPDVAARREAEAAAHGGQMQPLTAAGYGVLDPGDAAWVDRHVTPHPIRSYQDPLELTAELGNGLPVRYVVCTDPPYPAIHSGHDVVRRHGWPVTELATGHDAMITAPGAVVELLLSC